MSDINRLLQPVSASSPCGEDISFSPELDAIARAREFDDPSLDQGEWATELKEADWGFVLERCADLIASRSKDLRLAVWMAEAGAKVHSFRGLGDGYALIAGLCEAFWDTLYPLPDEGDHEQRIGNLSWLLVRSAQLVREMPLTEGRHSAYSMIDFETARHHAAEAERPGAGEGRQQAGPKLADVESARQKSSRAFYNGLLADARYCLESLCRLEKALDARLGMDGPGFSAVKDALDGAIRFIVPLADDPKREGGQETDVGSELLPAGAAMNPAMATIAPAGAIQSRTQALAQLRLVADFFRRTEPHSPVAYLADKAAAWGSLPLHDWLRQVIKDQGSLTHIEELLGVRKTAGGE